MLVKDVLRNLEAQEFDRDAQSKVNRAFTKGWVFDLFAEGLREMDQDSEYPETFWSRGRRRRRLQSPAAKNLRREFPGVLEAK